MLLLEQPPGVDDKGRAVAEMSWRERRRNFPPRWDAFKLVLPLLVISSLFGMETIALQLWLRDELFSTRGFLSLLLMAVAPFLLVLVVLLQPLLPLLGIQPARKTLRVEEEGIKLSHTKYGRVKWQRLRRWFLARVPGKKGLVTLTVESGDGKSLRRYWSMALEAREQRRALLAELKRLRQAGRTEAPVFELSQPMPERKLPRAGSWLVAVAFWILLHSLFLLMAGVMSGHSHNPSGSSSRFTPEQKEKARQAIRQAFRRFHISNRDQVRTICCVSGGLMTTAGAGLFVWGMVRQRRQMTELNRLYDLELEKITLSPLGPGSS